MSSQPASLTFQPRLRDQLQKACDQWCMATGRSAGALSSVVANHGGVFKRLDEPSASITDLKLEQFARFLIEPANWPQGVVGSDAVAFAHGIGITAQSAALSAGKSDEIIHSTDGVAA